MSHFETTILNKAGVTPDGNVASATAMRSNIFAMSQAAEDAVLRPVDFGAFAHDLRAALASRVARLAGDDPLAEHYLAGAAERAPLADPNESDAELASVLAFVDKVANHTRNIAAEDIQGLQAVGISDADIVRLCELVAFLAYQTRVIAGLRMMQDPAA